MRAFAFSFVLLTRAAAETPNWVTQSVGVVGGGQTEQGCKGATNDAPATCRAVVGPGPSCRVATSQEVCSPSQDASAVLSCAFPKHPDIRSAAALCGTVRITTGASTGAATGAGTALPPHQWGSGAGGGGGTTTSCTCPGGASCTCNC
eukprot:Hpha_TRINITY_DN12994_c0_g1::TRINITY_DN12994_c0_g1_i3::g.164373::m.164373